VVAFLLGNLALRPMEELSHAARLLNSDYARSNLLKRRKSDTVVRVSNKIERIGQRMRNVEEVFSALKENLDQVLGNLQDGIMLFTGRRTRGADLRRGQRVFCMWTAMCCWDCMRGRSSTAPRFWAGPSVKPGTRHHSGAGRDSSPKPATALRFRWTSSSTTTVRAQGLGALLTLHDQESVEVIESELELSRRMAAIGRLTSGVGHEVKNPINAIVVHLELLKSKLGNRRSGKCAIWK
jgi:hypothetical protein